jgi:hypothetical protein
MVTRSSDWGKGWTVPDTSIRGGLEANPVIAVNWGSEPDSLCIAFTRFATPNREIRVARNAFVFAGPWPISYPDGPKDDFDPSMAIDPVRGNAVITYTRGSGPPNDNDAMYLYSTDLFKTFTRDSIATGLFNEDLTSVSYTPYDTGYSWRVAYRTAAGDGTILYKAINNTLAGFHATTSSIVSQYRPAPFIAPAVGWNRDNAGTRYHGNCIYVGFGPQDVYFDGVDLTLDVKGDGERASAYALCQNYPNPFNPATSIPYQIAGVTEVRLAVFDQLGREVARLVNEQKQPGSYTVRFDGAGLASGVYFYRLEAGGYLETRKFLLLK